MTTQLRRQIKVSDSGDVTVVSFLVQKILNEEYIKGLGEELLALVEREDRRKVVLDFSNVEYLSSAALGKCISLQFLLWRVGGGLALCRIDPQIAEVFEIQKLDKFFRIFDTPEEALASLQGPLSDQFLIACPAHACPGHARATTALALKEVRLRCPECKANFSLRLPDAPPGGEPAATVSNIRLETYARQDETGKAEYMELRAGIPFTLQIVGRLDLFTSAVFEKLWRSVPSPRRLIIDCSEAWDISERGAEVLARLVTRDGEGRVVVVMKEDKLPNITPLGFSGQ
jgi:anti-sigma B factor antagonist